MKRFLFIAVLSAMLFTSCKKDSGSMYDASIKAALSVEFDNIAGSSDLQLNTGNYVNASGENFKVTKLKYFVSNFVLTSMDGSTYTVPQDSCYFLVDESDASTREPVLKVPEGEYRAISFMVGVDSLRNTMDISRRTGVLDPTAAAADMYWSWNSGYIFFKIDGTSPASTTTGNVFMYHVGGFGGYSSVTANNLRTISLDLGSRGSPKVKAGREVNVHLFVDILKVMNGVTNLSFAATPMIHSVPPGTAVANNYRNMFVHDHTEN